jgi:Zn-dependent protease with chaperone function
LLADALQKLTERHPGASKAGFLSTHPSTDERMRRLRLLSPSTPPSE